MDEIIEKAKSFVEEVFRDDYSGHDAAHTMRVFRTAAKLAEAEGADAFTVQLAALLHDVDDSKLSPETSRNKERAVSFMRENGLPADTIGTIRAIIESISFRGTGAVVPETIEGKCVQDADRLDAIGAVGIARAFAFGGSHNRVMYDPSVPPRRDLTEEAYRSEQGTTINHFYEKLFKLGELMNTESARRIAKGREAFLREFVERFMDEWDGGRPISSE